VVRAGQASADVRLCAEVVRGPGSAEGGAHRGGPVVPIAAPLVELLHGQRQLPGARVEPGVGSSADRGLEHVPLGGEPGHRGLVVAKFFRRYTRPGHGRGGWHVVGSQQQIRGVRGVQVMVQQPALRCVPVGVGVRRGTQLSRVDPEQVVRNEPAWTMLADQPGAGELA
jgi:hypothetical protein